MAIYDWSGVSILEEEFFSRFFSFFNMGASLLMAILFWMLGTNNDYSFAFFKGSYTNTIYHSPSKLSLSLFSGIVFCICLICGVFIAYQKIRYNIAVDPNISNGQFNNIACNAPLITTYKTFLLLLVPPCCITVMSIFKHFLKMQEGALISLTIHLFFHVFFPMILVSRKKEFMTYLFREIKDGFII